MGLLAAKFFYTALVLLITGLCIFLWAESYDDRDVTRYQFRKSFASVVIFLGFASLVISPLVFIWGVL